MDSKKILPIAIIAIAVIALVAYAAFFKPSTPTSSPYTNQTSGAVSQSPSAGDPASGGTGAVGGSGATSAAPAPTIPQLDKPVSSKDPATVVPAGTTLDQFVEKYYKAWLAKDWKTAYDLQPYSKKSGGDVTSFGQSREGYGLTSYEVGKPQISGNGALVAVQMNLGANGTWVTNWTFAKNDKGQWVAQDSKVSMMGQ